MPQTLINWCSGTPPLFKGINLDIYTGLILCNSRIVSDRNLAFSTKVLHLSSQITTILIFWSDHIQNERRIRDG